MAKIGERYDMIWKRSTVVGGGRGLEEILFRLPVDSQPWAVGGKIYELYMRSSTYQY